MPKTSTSDKETSLGRLRSIIDHVTNQGMVVTHFDNSNQQIFPVAIPAVEGAALRDWVIKEKASHTIEIGFAYGISTLFICEGLLKNENPKAKHLAIDPYQANFKNVGLQLLNEAGVANLVEHVSEESQIALPRYVSEHRQFDFAFVDGSHLFDRVFLDLIYLGRLVKPEGVIFADDYQAPAVARAISFCITNLNWKLEETSISDSQHQWAVLRTPLEPIHRQFPHFVDF